jgi:tetratricopeptide (TPR) repeat protein
MFLLFLVVSWYGWRSIQLNLLLAEMQNYYKVGQMAARKHQPAKARALYKMAAHTWEKASKAPEILFPEMGGQGYFLTAGNAYRMLRQFRRALQCYRLGLKYDPNSVNLLTSMGISYYALGDYDNALLLLEKSSRIAPLSRYWQTVIKKLRTKTTNETAGGE